MFLVDKEKYFDDAATAIPDEEVQRESLSRSIENFANPSSIHDAGKNARKALEDARAQIARSFLLDPKTLFFTSGGTEANQIVITNTLLNPAKVALLVGAEEHPSVLNMAKSLKTLGTQVYLLKPNKLGAIDTFSIKALLSKAPCNEEPYNKGTYNKKDSYSIKEKSTKKPFASEKPSNKKPFEVTDISKVGLVCLMLVNNEVGAVSDILQVAKLLRELSKGGRHIHIHVDAVQALGKVPFLTKAFFDAVDSVAFAAHKIGAPRGFGCLYMKSPSKAFLAGGGQEGGVRSGTENLFGALCFAACVQKRHFIKSEDPIYQAQCALAAYFIHAINTLDGESEEDAQKRASKKDFYKEISVFEKNEGEKENGKNTLEENTLGKGLNKSGENSLTKNTRGKEISENTLEESGRGKDTLDKESVNTLTQDAGNTSCENKAGTKTSFDTQAPLSNNDKKEKDEKARTIFVIPRERRDFDERFSPYIVTVAFLGIPGKVMVRALSERGFMASSGSACSRGQGGGTVLKAMGLSEEESQSAVRFSFPFGTKKESVDCLLSALKDIAKTFGLLKSF